ncbi:MAG: long-chain fatty acid--CoA ligase [Candidatus Bathyarchaeota archaeon]|nr:long-chain fatty acid--CoA ligase [Candidatus Bathyarchaeota archaeon]
MAAQHVSWFKNWPLDVPKSINYPPVPLQHLLEKAAQDFPNKAAIAFFDKEITYRQLNQFCNQFANALFEMGIQRGDRVAVYLPNTPQFIIAFFGALKAGAAVTAISPLHREREVEYQLADSGAKTIVALDSLCPIVEAVRQKTQLKNVIATSLDEFSSESPAPIPHDVLSLKCLVDSAPQNKLNLPLNPAEDLAALQYTGGTTGTAKGAMLTHKNLLSNALAFAAWIRGTPNDVFLTALPLFHIYGMTTSMTVPISLGAKMVLTPKFESAKILQTIQQQKATVFCGAPTMYTVLLANPDLAKYDLTSIRVCISGASPLPPQVQKRFMEVTGGFLAEGYGLTEASPVTHCNPVDKTMATVKVGSIGLPIPDTQAKIVDLETGMRTLSVGETGELAVKGPQVMRGYWQKPEETALVFCDGWLLTGDIARMDSDGYFYITDRKKDLIKYKDYSVYPRELEDVLYEHPAVKLCAVVGKPDPAVGEVPKAFVVLKEGAFATETEIMAYVNDKVAPYKAIRMLEFRKELPVSGAGKVLRRQLK